MFVGCDVFLFSAVTPVHVGVGRSPGTVDLPIARDSFGVPYIPSSSLKGSVKSLCFRVRSRKFCENTYGWDIRVSEGGRASDTYVSPVVFTDGLLLLYPARIEESGGLRFAYVTSEMQLRRAADVLELCALAHGDVGEVVGDLSKMMGEEDGPSGEAYINGVYAGYQRRLSAGDLSGLKGVVNRLGKLPSKLMEGGVYVLGNEDFRDVVEAGLLRVTRVALDLERKTVRGGHLWSEEYVSQGAVFLTTSLYRDSVITADDAGRRHRDLLGSGARWYLVIGGKETIGKGIIKLQPVR